MMFSSNQVLQISGCLGNKNELEEALAFALKLSGSDKDLTQEAIDRGCKLLYQITEDGKYCIGWGFKEVPEGWKEYPFKFDINIVSQIIRQHLEATPVQEEEWDGIYSQGFVMKCVDDDENYSIENSFYGIVYFEPYTCFYAK